ncbi:MAG: SAM-dependent methyltransferase, partial [Sphingomicrobium sp.]
MAMIDTLLGKIVRGGRLIVAMPDGSERNFGDGQGEPLKVRLGDRKVALDIARNPRVGVGEAYMDGRLTVENGDILDLLRLVVGSNRWEDKGAGRAALNKGKKRFLAMFRRNPASRARENVAH